MKITYKEIAKGGIMTQTVEYHRNPTQAEIGFGYGATHYIDVPIEQALKADGKLKRWIVAKDGLRYYR